MGVPYDLTCWYVNARRIAELTGFTPTHPSGKDSQAAKTAELLQLKDAVVAWMCRNKPSPLEVLLAQGKLAVGSLFTHHSNFFFSGLSKVSEARRKGKPVTKLATGYSKLDAWQSGGRLEFEFHDEHLTSESAWSQMGGQQRKFLLGVVTDIQGGTIKCAPYAVANIVDSSSRLQGDAGPWHNHLEVFVGQIESFGKAETIQDRLTKASLQPLKSVPEADIKTAFAEIINEPMVPKDWGGESSDLFSSRVVLNSRRISTAFLLKGPAKFHPMTPADLGKNGDQIGRLFSEPAELLVLQHCHEVTVAVRKQMRAYAQQMGNPRRFCIIDGYDTLRVLKAYGKCGFAVDDGVRSPTR